MKFSKIIIGAAKAFGIFIIGYILIIYVVGFLVALPAFILMWLGIDVENNTTGLLVALGLIVWFYVVLYFCKEAIK